MKLLFWKKSYKKFTSDFGWFEMELPSNWDLYDDIEGTYSFYDPVNWKGNFRITPINVDKTIDEEFLDTYFINGYKKKYIGEYICAYIKDYNDDEKSIIFSWLFHKADLMFSSSYTTSIEFENTLTLSKELVKVEKVIKSVNLL